MDVFGTVVNAIHLVNKVVTYVQAVEGAKEDREKLRSEVSALGDLLKILHSRLANDKDDSANTLVKAGIRDALLRCYQDLRYIVEELERIASPTDIGKSSLFLERMKDIKWPFQKADIKAMLGRIERLKSLITLASQTSLMEFVRETRNELKNMGLNVEGIETAVLALEAAQKAHMKETQSLHVNLHDLVVKFQDSADGIAKMEDKIDLMGRNQNDHMVKGDRMQADLATVKENQELQDLIRWLSPLDFGEKHHMLFEKRARDTGEWFLNNSKFLAWRRGDGGYKTLWCPGHPGVGKSVMASLVINELEKSIPENAALVFIYFEYKTKYTLSQLVEVILKQLVRRRITRSVLESLRKHKAGIRPTSDELLGMLGVEVGSYDRVLVVIDALDEAEIDVWTRLLGRLQALREVRLIATSRDMGEIELGLPPHQRLDIMFDERDMRKYIEGRLESSVKFKRLLKKGMGVHEIVTGVMKKADGMFLLAQLHMNSLETKLSVRDLRRALDELPNTLDATYDEAMSRISDDHRALAYRIISWLIHAVQPMTIYDLQYALAVEDGMTAINDEDLHDEASLTSICVGLVVLRENTAPREVSHFIYDTVTRASGKIVGLVHYTTQEYFLHNPSVFAQFVDSPNFAITCLQFLAFGIFETEILDELRPLETPFAEYAMLFWGVHARAHCDDKIVTDLAMELLHDSRRVEVIGCLPCDPFYPSAINLCTHFGLKDYLEYLLDHGHDANSKDLYGHTVISCAAQWGQDSIVELLLGRDNVDINWQGPRTHTPLSAAAGEGHEATAGPLLPVLARHKDFNPRDSRGDTPIIAAARNGHSSIVELLARGGADINLRGQYGQTPLSVAARGGHEATVRLLLARDELDANPFDVDGDTPIISAAQRGHSSIVELLLTRGGVDINSRGSHGHTLLATAAHHGHEEILRLLLANDELDINPHDDDGDTPIINAARDGDSSMVELLLAQRGVDVNSRGRYGNTPLSAAAHGGHEAIVRLLLARDELDVNPRDDDGYTPVIEAVQDGNSSVVELLLARGNVDINSRGRYGHTLLSVAVHEGQETIVRLLLENPDLDGTGWRDDNGNTYLAVAAHYNNEEVARWFLTKVNIDINSKNSGGGSPLVFAASQGSDAVVKLLLNQDSIDVNSVDFDGRTPLDHAIHEHREYIIELLRAAGGCTGRELGVESSRRGGGRR